MKKLKLQMKNVRDYLENEYEVDSLLKKHNDGFHIEDIWDNLTDEEKEILIKLKKTVLKD